MEKTLIEQITELKDKANRYENMKERYSVYVDKIKQGMTILNEVLTEIDPFINENHNHRSKPKNDNIGIAKEIYEKMLSGLEVGTEFIEVSYGLDTQTAHNIMTAIKKLPNVERRKDGTKSFLYIQKEI